MAQVTIKTQMTLSAETLAQRLGVSVRHIRRLDSAGRLPTPIRLGGCVRWRADEIHAWLEAGAPDRKRWRVMKGGVEK